MKDQVDNLQKARETLVKMRRDWAGVLAGPYQRENTERAIDNITRLQAAIEAVDRATKDEITLT